MRTIAATLDPISPELALVCPELAERARLQPTPHPWELIAARAPVAPAAPGLVPDPPLRIAAAAPAPAPAPAHAPASAPALAAVAARGAELPVWGAAALYLVLSLALRVTLSVAAVALLVVAAGLLSA